MNKTAIQVVEELRDDHFDEWLEYFIIDHKISPNDVIYEGIVDGQMYHMTYRELFDKIRPYSGMRKRLREDFSKAVFTGESVSEAAGKIASEELVDKGLV